MPLITQAWSPAVPLWRVPPLCTRAHPLHGASLQTLSFGRGQFGAEEGRGRDGQNQNQKCAKGREIWEGGRKRREEGREHRGHGDCRYWLRSYCGGRGVLKRSNNQRATDQVVSPVRKRMLTHTSERTEKGYWEEAGDLT